MNPRLLKPLAAVSVLAVSVLMTTTAQAHRQWLLPASVQTDNRDGWITIDAAISENLFYFDHNPMDLDGLSIVGPQASRLSRRTCTRARRAVRLTCSCRRRGRIVSPSAV